METKEFIDNGLPYILKIYDNGHRHIEQKQGVEYPAPKIVKTEKELYSEASTIEDKINIIAKRLGLENDNWKRFVTIWNSRFMDNFTIIWKKHSSQQP